jgi:hypothetical protein
MRCGGGVARPSGRVSPQVVDTIASLHHIYRVLGKLGMANRAEAVDRGRLPGLIP